MKDESGIRYCDECGSQLAPDDKFCTQCGAIYHEGGSADGGKAPEGTGIGYAEAPEIPAEAYRSTALISSIFLWAWSALIIIDSFSALLFPDILVSLVQSYVSDPTTLGYSSWDGYREALEICGAIGFASGIAAAVSAALCTYRRYWKLALGACIFAAVIMLGWLFFGDYTSLLMLFCGLSVALAIYRCRPAFN